MSEANKALVRRHFEDGFNAGNVAVFDETVAHEYLEHAIEPFGSSEPGSVEGPTAMREVVLWLRGQFPDLHMEVEMMAAEGDVVAALVRSEGTNLGPLNGVIPPTGKRFSARQSHWFRVKDGKLVEHWATREDLPAMMQLGVIGRPGRPAA